MGPKGIVTVRRGKAALARALREKKKKMKKAKNENDERRMVPYNPNVTGSVRRGVKRARGVTGTILPGGNVVMVANMNRIRSVVSGPNRFEIIQKRPRLETLARSIGRSLMKPVGLVSGIPSRMLKDAAVRKARKRTERIRSAVKKNEAAAAVARSAPAVTLRELIIKLRKEVVNVSNMYATMENVTSKNATNLKRRMTRIQKNHNEAIKKLENLERDMMTN